MQFFFPPCCFSVVTGLCQYNFGVCIITFSLFDCSFIIIWILNFLADFCIVWSTCICKYRCLHINTVECLVILGSMHLVFLYWCHLLLQFCLFCLLHCFTETSKDVKHGVIVIICPVCCYICFVLLVSAFHFIEWWPFCRFKSILVSYCFIY